MLCKQEIFDKIVGMSTEFAKIVPMDNKTLILKVCENIFRKPEEPCGWIQQNDLFDNKLIIFSLQNKKRNKRWIIKYYNNDNNFFWEKIKNCNDSKIRKFMLMQKSLSLFANIEEV